MRALIKRQKLAVFLLAGLLAICLGRWAIPNKTGPRAYKSIRNGMTAAEVQAIFGPPTMPAYIKPLQARSYMNGIDSTALLEGYKNCQLYHWVERGMFDSTNTTVIIDDDKVVFKMRGIENNVGHFGWVSKWWRAHW
jgi:hypothetical protein